MGDGRLQMSDGGSCIVGPAAHGRRSRGCFHLGAVARRRRARTPARGAPAICILHSLICILWLCLGRPAGADPAQPAAVPLGVTDLLADPDCTVGYRLFGKEPRVLGRFWTGYDPFSGVYFQVEPRDEGRTQVFMHCPWAQGPGVTFADFPLRLPPTTRIRLDLSTALRASAPASDGVTYRVSVDDKVLWETHCTWKTWRDAGVDLSAFAGRAVVLRLEVDPGPQRNSTDDWSLWGKAEILAGTDAEISAARARADAERAAQRRRDFQAAAGRAGADLLPFSRGDVRSVLPNTAGAVQGSDLSQPGDGDEFVFSYGTKAETIEYQFDTRRGFPDGLRVRVGGKVLDPPPFEGGARVRFRERELGPGSDGLSVRLLDWEQAGNTLICRYEYAMSDALSSAARPPAGAEAAGRAGAADLGPARLTVELRAEGKSLFVWLEGAPNRFSGFTVRTRGAEVPTVFATGAAPRLHRQGVFLSAFPDLWVSNASAVGGDHVSYGPLTDGARRPLRDTFVLTVSRRYEETLANVPHAPSPFLKELADRVVLDAWGGSFAENARWLREMAGYGVRRLLIIKHVWQRDGYDRTYPNVFPANASMGGDAGLRALSQVAREIGHRFCVHENFYDYYPNAEAFRTEDCALDPAGKRIPGWDNGSVRAVILKPSQLMEYARRFSPDVRKRYGCDAAYHDIMPTWNVDFDARVPDSGIIRRTHETTRDLCDYDRSLFRGPVLFEAIATHHAGLFDGGCNHGVDTFRTPAQVAFELLKVHPKTSNHGFGYYERWLPWGYGPGWHSYVMTDRELDRYRATTIAFGRTGFIGQQLMKNPHGVVREYHLMRAFGRAYTGKPLRRLAYFADGGWIDAATAARYGECARLRATYEGGQEVYVNLANQPWTVAGHTLPPDGSLTTGPRGTAYTAVRAGRICDYARCGNTVYADARSHQWLPPTRPAPITPALGEWKENGDGSLNITVRWKVERTLDRDYTLFWHFKEGGQILFQSDHAPAAPTSSWRVGATVEDGPHRIVIPAAQAQADYDLVVGLYTKDGRAPLAGGADEMRIATLHVTREGGKVRVAELRPAPYVPAPGSSPDPYLVDANREKKVLDFGDVATNGAVVVERLPPASTTVVTPVPAGEPMRLGLASAGKVAAAWGLDGRKLPNLKLALAGRKVWVEIPAGVRKVQFGP